VYSSQSRLWVAARIASSAGNIRWQATRCWRKKSSVLFGVLNYGIRKCEESLVLHVK
jgi:hypothetical protein